MRGKQCFTSHALRCSKISTARCVFAEHIRTRWGTLIRFVHFGSRQSMTIAEERRTLRASSLPLGAIPGVVKSSQDRGDISGHLMIIIEPRLGGVCQHPQAAAVGLLENITRRRTRKTSKQLARLSLPGFSLSGFISPLLLFAGISSPRWGIYIF